MFAIETTYKGYKFRSRLEARWAVFFDFLGIPWLYEVEGYHLPSGNYLPDFFLPDPSDRYPQAGYWVEVKGVEATAREKLKLIELCQTTKHTSHLVVGLPGDNPIYHMAHSWSAGRYWSDSGGWRDGPWKSAADYDLMELCSRYLGILPMLWEPRRLQQAINAARSARFEFGESEAGR